MTDPTRAVKQQGSVTEFFAVILMVIGGLVGTLSGLCTAALYRPSNNVTGFVLLFGAPWIIAGAALFVTGGAMFSLGRRERAATDRNRIIRLLLGVVLMGIGGLLAGVCGAYAWQMVRPSGGSVFLLVIAGPPIAAGLLMFAVGAAMAWKGRWKRP